MRHRSVLLDAAIKALAVRSGGDWLDATLGEGGHSQAMLEASAPDGRVTGLDRDAEAVAFARRRLAAFGDRFTALHARFGDLGDVAGPGSWDGILFDLGVRSPQLDDGHRGFSLQHDGPVDMRMDQGQGQTAAELLEDLDEAQLTGMLRDLGEEPRARPIARAILAGRPWTSTRALAECVARASGYHGGRTHPATRTFQALRMAVNDELGELERGLDAALERVRPGGRVAVISFHSLEDRLVKQRFREAAAVGTPRDAYGAPLVPPSVRLIHPGGVAGREADADNPRARSARLRAVERLPVPTPPVRRTPAAPDTQQQP